MEEEQKYEYVVIINGETYSFKTMDEVIQKLRAVDFYYCSIRKILTHFKSKVEERKKLIEKSNGTKQFYESNEKYE